MAPISPNAPVSTGLTPAAAAVNNITAQAFERMPAAERALLPPDVSKLTLAGSAAAVTGQVLPTSGQPLQPLQAGTDKSGSTVFVTIDTNSATAARAQINVAEVQAQSNATLQTNLNNVVNNAQLQQQSTVLTPPPVAAVTPEPTATGVSPRL